MYRFSPRLLPCITESQFVYHSRRLSYDDAKDACLKEDTQLVKINTSAKYSLVQAYMNSQ